MSHKLKVNFADEDELTRIPGVGPKLAKSLVTIRQLQGNITMELLKVLTKRTLSAEVLESLDFSESWEWSQAGSDRNDDQTDLSDDQSVIETKSDGETMISNHGQSMGFKHQPLSPSIIVNVPAKQEGQAAMATASASEVSHLCALARILLEKQGAELNPVVKPKRLDQTTPRRLATNDDSDTESHYPRPQQGRSAGRRNRLLRPTKREVLESSDDDWMGNRHLPLPLPAHGASTPFVARKAGRNILRDVPKSLSYDGKSNWQSFLLKFTQYANSSGWSDTDCQKCLLHCMTGKALDFCARHLRSNPELPYKKLLHKLEGRFGEMLPDSAQAMFFAAKQKKGESLEDWADRIQYLATEAFRDLPERYSSQQTVDRFCQGLLDAEAGHSTFMQKFPSMDMAINDIRLYQHSKSDMAGRQRRYQSGATDYDDNAAQVCAVQTPGSAEWLSLDKKVSDLADQFSQLLKSQSQQRGPPRGAGRKYGRGCFTCGSLKHFARDCPQKQSLNRQGAGREANSRPTWGRATEARQEDK